MACEGITGSLLGHGSWFLSAVLAVGFLCRSLPLPLCRPSDFSVCHSSSPPRVNSMDICGIYIERLFLSFLLLSISFLHTKQKGNTLITSNVSSRWYSLKYFLVVRHEYLQQRGLPHREVCHHICWMWNIAAVGLCSQNNTTYVHEVCSTIYFRVSALDNLHKIPLL